MPDRLPPRWGHEPEDGRDLDALLSAQAPLSVEETLAVEEMLTDEALLSGQLAGLSDSQRPVAGAMFALRAGPAESELASEAAARAAFRALVKPAGTVLADLGPAHPVPAGHAAGWSPGYSGGAELHRTLVLPVPATGQGQRPPARHRHRRRSAGGRGGWRVMALLGSAAAVVAIGAAALAGTFSGAAGHGGQSANPSAAQLSTRPSASPTGTQVVLGNGLATTDPTSSATPKASAAPGATAGHGAAPRPADLCRQYFELFTHHSYSDGTRGDRTKEKELFDELSGLAGSPMKVFGYCVQQLDPTSPSPGFPYSRSGGDTGRPDFGAETGQDGSGQAGYGPWAGGPGPGGSR